MALSVQRKSIFGKQLGIGRKGELISHGIAITSACADAAISVGAESTNVRTITIQLKDANGANLTYQETVEIVLYADATPTDFGTNGSTGLAAGASGKLLAVVAGKVFKALSTSAGLIVISWTDTGTQSFAIGVRVPTGRTIMSTAQANT